mmetsp:Transcript_46418/g.123326  ORF Transcript_46418/g.123326 Transcript_46418/m.123326 type:complete len:86 (+) Transcript_46418:207-464(+)
MERRRDGLVIFAISWEGLVRQGAFVRRPCDWSVSWQRVVTDIRTPPSSNLRSSDGACAPRAARKRVQAASQTNMCNKCVFGLVLL